MDAAAGGHVIASRLAAWGVTDLPLERALFGTAQPDAVAAAVDAFCRAHLGSPIDHYEFFESSSGSVHGVVLGDGRAVVVKGHRPSVERAYLDAIAGIQHELAEAGYPAPRPCCSPVPSGAGHVTAETMLARRQPVDARDARVRGELARGLSEFVARTREHTGQVAAVAFAMAVPDGALYPVPHSPRFDFAATGAGAEWIDGLARAARARVAARPGTGAPTVVHGDWRAENVAIAAGRLAGVFDWDSVHVEREALAVAIAATTFSVDWQQPPGHRFPEPHEMAAFVRDYEDARAEPFSESDRDLLAAAIVATLAYGARCEHAIPDHAPPLADSQRGLLQRVGTALLEDGLDALG